jgi:hypothetical protein
MAGSNASSRVSVEMFVEQNEIFPIRIDRVPDIIPVAWPASLSIASEERAQSTTELIRHLLKVQEITRGCWAFDLKVIPVEGVIAVERLN